MWTPRQGSKYGDESPLQSQVLKSSELVPIYSIQLQGKVSKQGQILIIYFILSQSFCIMASKEGFYDGYSPASSLVIWDGHEAKGLARGTQPLLPTS